MNRSKHSIRARGARPGLAAAAALCSALLLAVPSRAAQSDASDSPIITKDPNPSLRVPISLNAQDASLSDILRVLAERSSMNFVAGQNVQNAKITIILNKTP